jgi:hypothetical protein
VDEISVTFKSVPIPTGVYQVGTSRYDLEDPYRKDLRFPAGRLIPIQIYFPMKKGLHTTRPKIFEERAHLGPFHTSFMDHGYVNPPLPKELNEPYFNGTSEERIEFFNLIREEIRHFLASHLGISYL